MAQIQQLRKQRNRLLDELRDLDEIRRGSIVEQYVVATRKDGGKRRRGPYVLYSYKEKGKTVSRRLTKETDIPLYRNQIENFRRFRHITAELLRIGEQISDLALREQKVKKTSKHTSKSRSTQK
jgi:hypothetical protein